MLFEALQLVQRQVIELGDKAEVIIDSLLITGHGPLIAGAADGYVGALPGAPESIGLPAKTIA